VSSRQSSRQSLAATEGSGPDHPVVNSPEVSRFLSLPEGVRWEAGAAERTGVTYPEGFRAAGVTAGLKQSGALDLGIVEIATEWREESVSAAVFTTNAFAAAPVVLSREQSDVGGLQALVMNSGNANACTGDAGMEVARQMRATTAELLAVADRAVGVASTGIIGKPLDQVAVLEGIRMAAGRLDRLGGGFFAQSIMTTDRFPKICQVDLPLTGGTVRLGACAKGAGMIAPGMATMLAAVTTDLRLSSEDAQRLLAGAAARSFNRVSVDGEMSTNDCVFLLASGASGVELQSRDLPLFGGALDGLLLRMALMMLADGEGARRVARIEVRGAPDEARAVKAARAVADSLLVKTALHGADPNWGRILSAVGAALAGESYPAAGLSIGGVRVVRDAAGRELSPEEASLLACAVKGSEVPLEVDLGAGPGEAQAYFSDIGHEYVTINAEYHT